MFTTIDLETWNRKSIYHFFKDFDDPFFNICATLEVSNLLDYCKRKGSSFNLVLLYHALKTANQIDAFRTRGKDDEVVIYDVIDCGSTILHDDETFSFCPFEYQSDLEIFIRNGKKNIDLTSKKEGIKPRPDLVNVIHFSVIPWIKFTAIKHARKFKTGDTIPKITFGKFYGEDNNLQMPVSIEVNHAMMDAIHVHKYLEMLQRNMNAYH